MHEWHVVLERQRLFIVRGRRQGALDEMASREVLDESVGAQ